MRRFILPGLVVVAAVALLSLLAFGVAGQNSTSSLDSQVARGHFPTAPSLKVALPVLGSTPIGQPGRLPRQGGGAEGVRLAV